MTKLLAMNVEDLVRIDAEFDSYRAELFKVFLDECLVIIYIINAQVAFEGDGHFNLAALCALEDQITQVDFLFAKADG